ncbi:MAG: serine hydrolase domain-containing protein [Cyclobacteriaceae bacterium]
MKHLAILTLCLTLFSCTSETKQKTEERIPVTTPDAVGFSIDSLKKIETIVNEYVDKKAIPGATILIARNGKILYEKAFGYDDITTQTPMRTDHIFRVASMTKPIVSAAALQLYEEGKLKPDDKLSQYIPEFANVRVLDSFDRQDTTWTTKPADREITIHDLLTHTSGISYGFTNPTYGAIYGKLGIPDAAHPYDFTIMDMAKKMATAPLVHQPGEKWTYGLSTDILGAVIEVVSGKSLGEYVHENILNPLQLNHSGFWLPDSLADDLATFYMPDQEKGIVKIPEEGIGMFRPDFPVNGARKYYSGGSGLSMTARDYFVFSQAILNGGIYDGTRILKEETVELMRTNQIPDISARLPFGFGYGYGIATKDSNDFRDIRKGKFSWGGAFNTTFWIDPVRDLVVVIMSQVVSNPEKNVIDSRLEAAVNSAFINQ